MKNRTLPSTQLGDRNLDESLDFQSPELQSALQLWNSKRIAAALHARGDIFARRPRALYGKHRPNQRRKSTVPVSIPTDRHEYKVNRKRDQPNEYLDEICGDEALKNVVRSFDYILKTADLFARLVTYLALKRVI